MVYVTQFGGKLSEENYRKLADSLILEPEYSEANIGMLTEYGWLPGYRWNSGGEEWNLGGWSPILDVTISVSAIGSEVRADPDHFGLVADAL